MVVVIIVDRPPATGSDFLYLIVIRQTVGLVLITWDAIHWVKEESLWCRTNKNVGEKGISDEKSVGINYISSYTRMKLTVDP